MINSTYSSVHDPHSTINKKETFLQDRPVILKRMLQNYYKISNKCFLGNDHQNSLVVLIDRYTYPEDTGLGAASRLNILHIMPLGCKRQL